MEIHLVRHTTPKVDLGICYGQTDLELADSFHEEAQVIIKSLPKSIDLLYTSPLKRCQSLTRLISSDFIIHDALKELDFGLWEMQPWDAIPKKQLDKWMENYIYEAPPGGESAIQLMKRVKAFYEMIQKDRAKSIVIVSHLGVIRCFYALFNQVSIEESFSDFKLPYGGTYSFRGQSKS